jgi:ribose transport system ATP-binding protein
MLHLSNITKTFGSVQALKDVSISVKVGEVVGLVGENGAGKSTLMKVLNGIHQPDAGAIELNGARRVLRSPRDAAANGIGMVFQEQSLIPNISIAENIFLGNDARFVKFGRIDWRAMNNAARRQLEKVGLDVDPGTITSDLTFIQRQMVELAKVLTLEDVVDGNLCILLDEPTSMLEQDEIDILFSVIRKQRLRAGIIFISHRLDEVIEISDTIYVMKDGAVVSRMEKAEASPSRIHHLMVGREAAGSYYKQDKRQQPSPEIALKVAGLTRSPAFRDISFDLRRGEVLALVGTEGAGAEHLVRSLFGLEKVERGTITLNGTELANVPTDRVVEAGIGYVPRERKIEGLVEEMSVEENIYLPLARVATRFGLFDFSRMATRTRELMAKLRIKAPDRSTPCVNLSGGNQQKVVLARWYRTGARLFLLDHPTRGLDVGAKEDVYDLIREICAEGASVILIGDTLEEALGLAHTIVVLRDGRQTARFDNAGEPPLTPLDLIPHMV